MVQVQRKGKYRVLSVGKICGERKINWVGSVGSLEDKVESGTEEGRSQEEAAGAGTEEVKFNEGRVTEGEREGGTEDGMCFGDGE